MMQRLETKGDLMKAIYSQDELRNIDVALPRDTWDKVDTFLHVMNYNNSLGRLENMLEVAYERKIEISSNIILQS